MIDNLISRIAFFWICGVLVYLQTSPLISENLRPPSLVIEGYTSQVSYAPNEELSLHVSCSGNRFGIEVARLGADRVVVTNLLNLVGAEYPIPENASSHGCHWPSTVKFNIPPTWASGYYQILLRTSDAGGPFVGRGRRTAESECYFILRPAEPGKNTRILLQLASNTYNAYNNWGGFSLYAYHARSKVQGDRVSFQRPPMSQFNSWERPFVEWAERTGYVLDYCANGDLEFRPELLKSYKLVLSVGHDEYWSTPMRDHLERYIAAGGNVAFFSGNTCCWQVRSEDNGSALTCWKQSYNRDPIFTTGDHRTLSTLWSHHLLKRPENQLTGVGFLWGGYHKSHGQYMDGKGSYTVHRPNHWIFEGTQLKAKDEFGGKDTIVGYECDGCEMFYRDGLPYPTGRDGTPTDFQILATCPARWHPDDAYWYERFEHNREGASVLGLYHRGGTVFTTGSTDWSHGLRGKDPIVERITRNILDRLGR